MKIESSRFGAIECEETDTIEFKHGVIGFPQEKRFILIQHGETGTIGWLQSAITPEIAFPVVSAHGLMPEYPAVPVSSATEAAGLEGGEDNFAVMVVLSAPEGQPATVNLLAPLVVNAATRQGAQVFLDGSRFTTRESFVLPSIASEEETDVEEVEDELEAQPEPAAAAAP